MSTNTNFGDSIDNIESLPVDDTVPSHSEIQLVDSLFKEKYTMFQVFFSNIKDVVILCFIFILVSLPQTEGILKKYFPGYENPYVVIFIKSLLFGMVYFVVKNLYLVRKV